MQETDITDWPFPIKDAEFNLPFNIRVLRPGQSVLKRSDSRDQQLALKQQLSDSADLYFQALPESEEAQREVIDYLNLWSPGFDLSSFDGPNPLLHTGLQVQEDLILLEPESPFRMIAGAVFFPSGWSVQDKIGLSNSEIHSPVPGYAQHLHDKTERLLGGLKYARPVSRDNWGIRPTDQWNQLPMFQKQWDHSSKEITAENAGESCFLRGEYQTISRLKKTGAILFTIHSWQKPLKDLTKLQNQILLGVLKSCPPDSLHYKGIASFEEPLLEFLNFRSTS